MYDNKTLKVQSTRETLFPVYVCVCVCVRARRALKLTSQGDFWVLMRPNDQIHIKHVKKKNSRLEEYSLKYSLYLKVNENSWEKIVCQYFVLKWQTASSMLIKEKITHSSYSE